MTQPSAPRSWVSFKKLQLFTRNNSIFQEALWFQSFNLCPLILGNFSFWQLWLTFCSPSALRFLVLHQVWLLEILSVWPILVNCIFSKTSLSQATSPQSPYMAICWDILQGKWKWISNLRCFVTCKIVIRARNDIGRSSVIATMKTNVHVD